LARTQVRARPPEAEERRARAQTRRPSVTSTPAARSALMRLMVRNCSSWIPSFMITTALVACGGSSQQGFPKVPQGQEEAPDESWDTGGPKPSDDEPAEDAPKKPRANLEDSDEVPTQCSKNSKSTCVPPGKWVARLCQDVYADVALFMFQDGT